jgi:hypothetical protein
MTNHSKINAEILQKLSDYLLLNPDMRFGQALYNLRIVYSKDLESWTDEYYTNPEITLARMEGKDV